MSFRCTFSTLHFAILHLAMVNQTLGLVVLYFIPDMNKLLSMIFILRGYRCFKYL